MKSLNNRRCKENARLIDDRRSTQGNRFGAIISLACGAILNLGICRYAGKGQGEVSLLRQLWDVLRPGDVLLTDCLTSIWTAIVMLKQRGFVSSTSSKPVISRPGYY
jgi:hypothetical protein